MSQDNLRGIGFMILAMLFFAATDACVKLAAEGMPKGQVLAILGAGGGTIFALWTKARGFAIWTRDLFRPSMILRNGAEITATFSFITALSTVGISLASAIVQAVPLAVTLAAIVMLRERVGWRRWGAIAAGITGVLVILRPGMSGFDFNALWAVLAVVALALRDVSTRLLPPEVPSTRIACYGMSSLVPAGLFTFVLVAPPVAMSWAQGALMAGAVGFGTLGYYAMIQAMRTGEISLVAPFRFSRILFALIIGYAVFGEQVDGLTYLGAAITIGAGVYAFWREGQLARRAIREKTRAAALP